MANHENSPSSAPEEDLLADIANTESNESSEAVDDSVRLEKIGGKAMDAAKNYAASEISKNEVRRKELLKQIINDDSPEVELIKEYFSLGGNEAELGRSLYMPEEDTIEAIYSAGADLKKVVENMDASTIAEVWNILEDYDISPEYLISILDSRLGELEDNEDDDDIDIKIEKNEIEQALNILRGY